jgi:hypothetical protein
LLAREPGYVLWTDDYVQAKIAANEFGVASCWTQVALESQVMLGTLTGARFAEVSAKLAGFGYYFTGLNPDIITAAAHLAEWQPNRPPLGAVLNGLSSPAVPAHFAFALAARFILEVYRHNRIPENQIALIVKTLEVLSERPEGRIGVLALQKTLPNLFGLNVVDLASALETFDVWLRQKNGRVHAKELIVPRKLWPSF